MMETLKDAILKEQMSKTRKERMRNMISLKSVLYTVLGIYLSAIGKIGVELLVLGLTKTVEQLYSMVLVFIVSVVGTAIIIIFITYVDKQTLSLAHNKNMNTLVEVQSEKNVEFLSIKYSEELNELENKVSISKFKAGLEMERAKEAIRKSTD